HRQNLSNNQCHISSQAQFSILTKGQESGSQQKRMERLNHTINGKSKAAGLVDRKPPKLEWKKPDSGNTNNNLIHRRINLRLGCVPGELRNSWKMVTSRTTATHK